METTSGVLSLNIDQSEGMPAPPHLSDLVDDFEDDGLGQQPREPDITTRTKSTSATGSSVADGKKSDHKSPDYKSRKNCNGTPIIPDNPLLDTDGVTCGECMEKFTNLQKYMEHSCSGSLSGATKQHDNFTYEINDDDGELSDIENFEGKIVYQPDGSAYLIDNVGDSDDELLPNLPEVFEGASRPFNSKSNQLTVQPPIVNSLHIPCTTAFMNMNMAHEYGMTLPGITSAPVMQSYRVYDVRTQNNKKIGDGDEGENEQSNKEFIFENSKPILMCFLCKLSFGFAKSFVGHAVNEHKLVLNEKEKSIMSRKNQSAIIQGLGKEKEPLLSFLEPQPIKTQTTSGSNYNTNGQAYYQQMLGTTQPSVSYIYPVSVAVSTNNSLVTTSTAQLRGPSPPVEGKTKEQGHNSSSDVHEDNVEAATSKQRNLPKNISVEGSKINPATSNEDEESLDSAAIDNNSKGTQSSRKESKAESPPLHFPNSSVLNTGKQQNGCATNQAPEVSNANSPARANADVSNQPEPSHKEEEDGNNSTYVNEDSTAKEEKDLNYRGPSTCKHDHPEEAHHVFSNYTNADGKISSSVECPKCDMVLGSSRSLGGHMTMMHSRNSCKTLKCPKCNWHYKYQQTLEAHMKEKHPESETKCGYCQTNQPHPRLARGETYTCGYKPFRCEICNYSTTTKGNLSIHMQSDKHLNNFQELQSGGAAVAATTVSSTASSEHILTQSKMNDPTSNKQKPKPTWRCDVCEYETNVARNLRIHMTSEKHMHNMLAVQHNMTQMQHDLQMNLGNYQHDDSMYRLMTQNMVPISIATESHLDPHAMMVEYPYDQAMYAAAIAGQLTPEMMEMETMGDDQPPVNEDPTKNEPLRMFQCSVCNRFISDDLDTLYDHIHQDRSVPTDSSWKIQIADVIRCNLCSYSTQLKANFQLHCKTDKHIQKLQLVNHIKEGGPQNEWRLKYMNVSNPTQVKCNACDYYTYSVEKLKAHVANYRHETSLKLFRHLQDIKITINSETKYYHCNMCNYSSKAKLSLIQHVRSMKHLRMEEEYLRRKADVNMDEADSPINEGVLDLSKKDRSFSESGAEEVKTERIAQQSLHAEHSSSKKSTISSSEASGSSSLMRTTTTQIYTCPYCKYSSIDQDRIRAHVLSQHSVKPQAVLRCPLCQDMCTNKINLEIHLVQVHSVSRDCIQRLMSTVERNEWMGGSSNPPSASPTSLMSPGISHLQGLDSPTNQTSQSPSSNMFASKVEEPNDANQGSDVESGDQYRCQKCHQVFQNLDGLYKHQNEVCPLKEQETPGGPGFLCWKKGCNQYFKTSAALQMHFKEIHAKRPQLPVSDRHVYKYRCNQCSLAFKTMEKLQIHSQYHMIRAATKCGTCDRSFRSIAALRKHMETSHMETNADMAQYFGMTNNTSGFLGIPTTSTPEAAVAVVNSMGIPVSATTSGIFSQSTGGDSSMQAVTPDVLDEKSQDSMSSDLYSELQEDSNQAMDLSSEQDGDGETNLEEGEVVQDSMHISEETYHDPTRKYKCHRCKVGFTKQSELSNHHKTLQHRRGCRAAYTMDKYLDPNRPYKCETCKESFTQKNILLVHYNSVSHLHKLKRSQNETESSPPDTSPSNDKKPFKCNICKVAYSQGSTLDIHMRSVLHQTRAAKLESAGAFGGLQHIGQQPDASNAYTSTLSQEQKQSVTLQHQLLAAAAAEATQQLAHLQAQQGSDAASAAAANAIASAALTQQLMDPNSLAFFQQQLLSTGMSSGMYTCGRCNSFFMTQEALAQHQTQCGMNDAATAAQFASQQKTYMTYTPRPSYPMMRSFLENYGFDLVQQFNEYAQGLPPNVDPKDKFKCDKCDREFSSVWVFKAHAEQDHKSFFPTDKIQQFSEVYREEYDKLQGERSGVIASNAASPSTPATPTESTATVGQSSATEQAPGTSQMEMLQSTSSAVATGSASAMPPPAVPSPAAPSCTASAMPPPAIPSPSAQIILPSAIPIPLQPMQTISYIDPSAYMQKSPKRARTRITDEQLKILRAHFDINNSPSEDQICEMSEKSGLPHKVIKHWFRNTLFKERQRNKDSPYNFNNPPSTTLPMSSDTQTSATVTTTEKKADTETMISESSVSPVRSEVMGPVITPTTSMAEPASATPETSAIQVSSETPPVTTATTNTTTVASTISETAFVSSAAAIPISSTPSSLIPPHSVSPPLPPTSPACSYSNSSSSKRAGRTRFTDYQIKMLQEFFENNAYPKDDDLEHLSKLLGLSPRVIVVWFQNARQKARKMFENQPPPETDAESGGARYRRTPGLNYQCNKCLLVFQRFFELIKHQKQHCYKDDDCSTTSYAGSSTPTSPNTPTNMQPEPPVSVKSEEKKSESSKSELLSAPQVHYQCDKCDLVFPQFDQWNEHQQVHFMQSFRSYMPQHNPFNMMYMPFDTSMNGLTAEQYFSAFQPTKSEMSSGKRKLSETDDTASETHSTADQDQPRDKRLRTTISPQQLEILYQKYQEDSNPTRRMLDMIARQVGLKKRVVQVWFQNTRARERKGQFRLSAPNHLHKRCPFCRAIFKAKTALEAHIKARHWDQLVNGNALDSLLKQSDAFSYGELGEGTSTAMSPRLYEDFMKTGSTPEDGDNLKVSSLSSPTAKGGDKPSSTRTGSEDCIVISDSQDDDSQDIEDGQKDTGSNGDGMRDDLESMTSSAADTGCSNMDDRAMDVEGESTRDGDSNEGDCDNDSLYYSETMSITQSSEDPNGLSERTGEDSEQRRQARELGKRFRTQMSQVQLKVLKCCFADYRTPTMHECELLGTEIGLPKRVVQVWFQNARAKDKKSKQTYTKHFGLIGSSFEGQDCCKLCDIQYSAKLSIRDHVFTETHIHNVKKHVNGQLEKDTTDSTSSVGQLLQHASPIEAQRAMAASFLPNHQAALLGHGHMGSLQSMQAHAAMSAFLGQVASPTEAETSKKDETTPKKESAESSTSGNSSEDAAALAAAAAAASQASYLPSMSGAEAAYMPYFFGGMSPYYTQAPFVYPLYSPEQAAAFFPYDPSIQMGLQAHLLQAQHMSPHHAAVAGFSPSVGESTKLPYGSSASKESREAMLKSTSTSSTTQETRRSRSEDKHSSSTSHSSRSSATHPNEASTSDHSIPADREAARKPSSSSSTEKSS
ncbi:zinc finger homeobox protein 3-like [Glandiceps talaboti]